jgi:hypothetical protein
MSTKKGGVKADDTIVQEGRMMSSDGRTRKRKSAKADSLPGGKAVKASFMISAYVDRQLTLHKQVTGKGRSEVVEELVRTHLPRYSVRVEDRKGPEGEGPPDGQG